MKNIFQNIPSLRAKSLSLIGCCVICVMVLFSCFSLITQKNQLMFQQKKRVAAIADRLAFSMSLPLWNLDHAYLKELIGHEFKSPEMIAIVIMSQNNEFILGGVRQYAQGDTEGTIVDIKSPEQMNNLLPGEPTTQAIKRDGVLIGTVKLYTTDRYIFLELQRDVLHEIMQGLIILACISILVYLGLNRIVLAPLKALSVTARELEHGNLAARAEKLSRDEVGQLGNSINAMAATLDESFQEREALLEELREQNDNLLINEEELRCKVDELTDARNSLQQNEAKYRDLVEHANSVIIRWSPEGILTFFNEFAEKTFGYAREEILGLNILGTIVSETESSGRNLSVLMQSIASHPENYLNNENENICKNGDRVWISWANKAIFDNEGNLSELLSVGQNITEKRMMEQQIIQQQKLEGIGMLAGGMAHDINNLLTPILISAEMASRKLTADHAANAKLATIRDAAGRIKDLVAQMLLFSRKQGSELQQLDLNGIVSVFMAMLRRTIRENITMDLKSSPEPCIVMADRTQLEQVLMNLAVNAQDAINDVGTITVETGYLVLDNEYCAYYPGIVPGRYVMLAVTDTGSGIDEETRLKMFEPFFTTKPEGKGTGLGLSTVYGIVRQHGGHLDVLSKPGSGTTFRIFLPMLDAFDAGLPQVKSLDVSPVKIFVGTLLLVEDNTMLRENIVEALRDHGIDVIATDSPREALNIFKERGGGISALLTDVIMPEMSGTELYCQLRKEHPGLPVLFMSGYLSDIEKHEQLARNPDIFLPKPFTIQALLQKLAAMNGTTVLCE